MNQKKKILLHGAVNTSNFGDCLFVDLFYRQLLSMPEVEPIFLEGEYGISAFNRERIGYTHRASRQEIRSADALLYISGGYFGDGDKRLISGLKRYVRYFAVGEQFIKQHKPILISGVGGERLDNGFVRSRVQRLLKSAEAITVRDQGTKRFFDQLEKQGRAVLTADTAQVLARMPLPPLNDQTQQMLTQALADRKRMFVHLTGRKTDDDRLADDIGPALLRYLNEHPDTGVVLGYDYQSSTAPEQTRMAQLLRDQAVCFYHYDDPWQLCALLREMDIVVTAKLHVGIVSCTLQKPVVSFPVHPYKTRSYFSEIGQPERCIALNEISEEQAYEQLVRWGNQPASVPAALIDRAEANLALCMRLAAGQSEANV